MKKLLLLGALLLAALTSARAQWQTPSYSLRGGWNSIYLHGDATHASIDQLFAAHTDVIEIWRWNPNPTQTQFQASPLIPSAGTPEWTKWVRGSPEQTTLSSLTGRHAYLVRCTGSASNTYSVPIAQKILPPGNTWVRNGANLLGFPARLSTGYPVFTSYFATFPAAIAANTRIYKYVGGDLGPANPVQVFGLTAEPLDRTQAYWFEAPVVSNFYAPIEVSPSQLDGLHFGRTGGLLKVLLRNRTAAAVTITIAPAASGAVPAGQTAILGDTPLKLRTYDATSGNYTETAIGGPFNQVVGPQSSVELSFTVNRAAMTGASGALYASFLRFTDSGSLLDIYLPASAVVTSLSGLWIGDVAVTDVQRKGPAQFHTCAITRTVTVGTAPNQRTTVTTVESRAIATGTNILSPLSQPEGTGGTLTYQWRKNGLPLLDATNATLTLNASEALESGAFGTATVRSFPLRVILHVDDNGVARLLSQVFLGRLAPAPHNFGLCTRETALKQDDKANSTRIGATHLPPDTDISTGTGSVALGQTLVRSVPLLFNASTNPFVHAYHPDHDNKNARFEPLGAGAESPTVTRALSFSFAPTAPATSSSIGWGSTVLGGTYIETVTGIHRDPLTVTGTFELRRVSELGAITTN